MNRKQFNSLNEGDILYCNGMCHNFKGFKVRVLRTENDLKNGSMVTITPTDERFLNMHNRVWDLNYKSLSMDPVDAEPVINELDYNL